MAHRKHLSPEGHAAPEVKKDKKTSSTSYESSLGQAMHKPNEKKPAQKPGMNKDNDTFANSHIKDEHGEY